MKILWITNILFPEAEQLIIQSSGELRSSGGWMLGAAEGLLRNLDICLYVATVSSKVSKLTKVEGKRIIYYVLPMGKGNQRINLEYISYWRQIKSELQPDVVHIHGTEFSHGYAYLKACGNKNVIISIQGILSAISSYYCAGISKIEIIKNITFRDLIKGSILNDKKKFEKRGIYEKEMLKIVKHVIGRTSWDRARVWAINPNINYHFCNETLRREFYDGSLWKYDNCNKHSIFVSQAGYPLKGFHQLLKAMPLILSHFPDTTIRVAGDDITMCKPLSKKLHLSGYGKYIQSLIKRFHLNNKVYFAGNLTGEEMKKEYLKANVFVCPSAIENSPNSLGEAQILGVPCIASYVGGIPDMMQGCEDNMYRFEEVEMLAEKVCRVFERKEIQVNISDRVTVRHNERINCNCLNQIYKSVCSDK